MSRAIRHITLTTGHVRDSLPGEVSPEAIDAIAAIIERMCAGEVAEPVPLPGIGAGYSIAGRGTSRCLVASVYADGPPSTMVCTIGVALHSRCGASLWRELHRWGRTPVVTDPWRCPPEPWVAAALDEGVAVHPDCTYWLGDFERCLAWAFSASRRK